jgi:hypothetical protein
MGFGLLVGFIILFDKRVTTLYNSLLHTRTSVHSHVFTSLCSVAASNSGRSHSSGLSNYEYIRPQLPASHSNSSQRLRPSRPLTTLVTHSPTDSTHLISTVLLVTSRMDHMKNTIPLSMFTGPCLVTAVL